MKKYNSLILLLLVSFQLLSQITHEEIISNHLETTGTRNLAIELTQFSIDGVFLQNKMDLPIKIQAKIPGKFRMDMEFNKLNFIKISNGDKNWEYNPMSDSVITKKEDEKVVQDFIQRWTGGLHLFAEGKIKIEMLGAAKVEDLDAYKLEVGFGGKKRIYFIDKLSFLILRIDDDAEEQKVTYYRDYRKVGKYFVPFSMVSYESGVPAISMQFSDVKLNPVISDSVFKKPQAE